MELNVKVGMCSSASGCDMAFDSKWVEWTPELQEAWDKSQEMKIDKTKGSEWCPTCGANVDEEHQYHNDYCACCGQRLSE